MQKDLNKDGNKLSKLELLDYDSTGHVPSLSSIHDFGSRSMSVAMVLHSLAQIQTR